MEKYKRQPKWNGSLYKSQTVKKAIIWKLKEKRKEINFSGAFDRLLEFNSANRKWYIEHCDHSTVVDETREKKTGVGNSIIIHKLQAYLNVILKI